MMTIIPGFFRRRKPMQYNTDSKYSISFPDDLTGKCIRRFRKEIDSMLESKPGKVFLDCTDLKQVSSSHVNVIWDAYCACNDAGVSLELIGITEGLIRVLKVLDLYEILIGPENSKDNTVERQVNPRIDMKDFAFDRRFKPRVQNISETIQEMKKYLGDHRFNESVILELETIFYEIATNIRLHAQVDKNSDIELLVELHQNKIAIKFIYAGIAFDPTVQGGEYNLKKVVQNRQKRGYGLVMINRMADKISYKRTEKNLNELVIEKQLGGNNG